MRETIKKRKECKMEVKKMGEGKGERRGGQTVSGTRQILVNFDEVLIFLSVIY